MDKLKKFPWDKYFMLLLAGIVYTVLFLFKSQLALASFWQALAEIKKLLVPLVLAIFFGGTARVLLKYYTPQKLLNGRSCLFTAGSIGSLLPPCPFIAYPVVQGFRAGGLSLPGLLVMLITTTVVETAQLFCGLAVFGLEIVTLRIIFAFLGSMFVGILLISFNNLTQTGWVKPLNETEA